MYTLCTYLARFILSHLLMYFGVLCNLLTICYVKISVTLNRIWWQLNCHFCVSVHRYVLFNCIDPENDYINNR